MLHTRQGAPLCLRCGEAGIHASIDDCLITLRAVRAGLRDVREPLDAHIPRSHDPHIVLRSLVHNGRGRACSRFIGLFRTADDAIAYCLNGRVHVGIHFLETTDAPAEQAVRLRRWAYLQ